jgi:hypothetical protein
MMTLQSNQQASERMLTDINEESDSIFLTLNPQLPSGIGFHDTEQLDERSRLAWQMRKRGSRIKAIADHFGVHHCVAQAYVEHGEKHFGKCRSARHNNRSEIQTASNTLN